MYNDKAGERSMSENRLSRTFLVSAVAASLVLFAGTVQSSAATAQDRANRDPAADRKSGSAGMNYLRLAGELAHVGVEMQDAVLLVAAARLEAMTTGESVDRESVSRRAGTESEGSRNTVPVDLYSLAASYGERNEAVRMLIAEGRSLASGRALAAGGPKVSRASVLAGTTDVYRVTFIGGSLAEVALTGDGDTDLDLSIYDEHGSLVCDDIGPTDDAYCSWVPRWTGLFRIHVENLGDVYNTYRLATN